MKISIQHGNGKMSRFLNRRNFFNVSALLLVLLCVGSVDTARAQQTGDAIVGTVTRLQKSAVAMQDAFPRILAEGDPILLGDVISTGKGTRLHLTMMDGAEVTLGEGTIFVVQEYLMTQDGGNAVMRLLEGAFVVTSGSLMKQANAEFTVETEIATIGIRGTTFWGGSIDGKFSVLLLDGKGVYVQTRTGSVDLSTPGEGTSISDADSVPAAPKTWPQEKVDRAKATVTFGN